MDLAHAIIKLTDGFGVLQLDNVAISASGRRASSLTLAEIVYTCTKSLALLRGPYDTRNYHQHRVAAIDPISFLEDVATEASKLDGGDSQRGGQLRIKRALCKATIEALFLRPSSSTGHLLTTKHGFLVVLPCPAATANDVVAFPRRNATAAILGAAWDGRATSGDRLLRSPAELLDTRPAPTPGVPVAGEDKEDPDHCADRMVMRGAHG